MRVFGPGVGFTENPADSMVPHCRTVPGSASSRKGTRLANASPPPAGIGAWRFAYAPYGLLLSAHELLVRQRSQLVNTDSQQGQFYKARSKLTGDCSAPVSLVPCFQSLSASRPTKIPQTFVNIFLKPHQKSS
jgi:hypothetical protein